jgi:hypothetical protein
VQVRSDSPSSLFRERAIAGRHASVHGETCRRTRKRRAASFAARDVEYIPALEVPAISRPRPSRARARSRCAMPSLPSALNVGSPQRQIEHLRSCGGWRRPAPIQGNGGHSEGEPLHFTPTYESSHERHSAMDPFAARCAAAGPVRPAVRTKVPGTQEGATGRPPRGDCARTIVGRVHMRWLVCADRVLFLFFFCRVHACSQETTRKLPAGSARRGSAASARRTANGQWSSDARAPGPNDGNGPAPRHCRATCGSVVRRAPWRRSMRRRRR